jgi:DNA-binding transcriptional MerR regulator
VRYLKTSEAAALLNVSPNTLRAWERRFGYPKPQRSPGKHRLYTHGEITALKDALQEGLSISSAVSRAREGLSADAASLFGALSAFESERADAAMEAALALRTLDRSVEEVLLPSLQEVESRHGLDSARWAFAGRWAEDWLRRAHRLGAPPSRNLGVVIGDASGGELDPDAAPIRALELFSARAGLRLFSLSVQGTTDLGEALATFRPDAVVVAGRRAGDDAVARWAYAVRASTGPLPITLFRREVGRPLRSRTTGARHLSSSPTEAQSQLLELMEAAPLRLDKDDSARPTRLVPRSERAS